MIAKTTLSVLRRTRTPVPCKPNGVKCLRSRECHMTACTSKWQNVKAATLLTSARYCHGEPTNVRKRPRFDRIGYQREDKIEEIQEKFDLNFCKDEFFRGVAESFLRVTNSIHDNNDEELEPLLSIGAHKYAQWVKDDSCYSEVIFPVEERDIFSLVVNNVEINHGDNDRENTVDITVTVTYGKDHRVVFGIPDSYLCSFAIFKFQRTFVRRKAHGDWMIARLQFYPPR